LQKLPQLASKPKQIGAFLPTLSQKNHTFVFVHRLYCLKLSFNTAKRHTSVSVLPTEAPGNGD
jgi:hypothetical protein